MQVSINWAICRQFDISNILKNIAYFRLKINFGHEFWNNLFRQIDNGGHYFLILKFLGYKFNPPTTQKNFVGPQNSWARFLGTPGTPHNPALAGGVAFATNIGLSTN